MTSGNRNSGEVFIITKNYNTLSKKVCRTCKKGFEVGQKVVMGTKSTKSEHYSRMRHIECYKDAKGNQIYDI